MIRILELLKQIELVGVGSHHNTSISKKVKNRIKWHEDLDMMIYLKRQIKEQILES